MRTLLVTALFALSSLVPVFGQDHTLAQHLKTHDEVIVKDYSPKPNDRVYPVRSGVVTYDSVASHLELVQLRKIEGSSTRAMMNSGRIAILLDCDQMRVLESIPDKLKPGDKPTYLVVEMTGGEYLGTFRVVEYSDVAKTTPRPPR